MTRYRRPGTLALCALAVVAAAWPLVPSVRASDDGDARHAAQLVRGVRTAAEDHDFAGVATVTWRGPKGVHAAQVRVSDLDGDVAVDAAGGATVVDEGRRTYLRDRMGWRGLVVEPPARDLPRPDRNWALSTAGARTVAGRAATVVVAARADGVPVQRLAVDDATGLLLSREVLDPHGRRERSVRFTSIDVGERAPSAVSPPAAVSARRAEPLRSVPDGYRAPSSPAGFELLTRSRHPDGVLLFYGDGVFTASLFEQQGDLDWGSLPRGGDDSTLADTRTRTYHEPGGDVAVWERDGLVYTFVSDAPSDVFARVVAAVAAEGRSTPESVVDFVLGPFGWG